MSKPRPDWQYVIGILILMVTCEIANIFTGRWFAQFSIVPRDIAHLPFIFTSPWLHGSISHFLSNVFSFAVLSFLLLEFGLKRYLQVSVLLVVMTGTIVWLFARDAYHLGASGVIYGYFAYLLLAGFLSKRIWLVLISLAVVFFYGGMIWGVLPSHTHISWESHLAGFISGLILAWFFRTKTSRARPYTTRDISKY